MVAEPSSYSTEPRQDDLARIALRHAIQDARRHRAPSARRRQQPARREKGGRPVPLAVAMVEVAEMAGWPIPVDTTLIRQWPTLAGRLADHLIAVSFDPASGVLRLRGKSLAWTTQGRLLANQIVQDVNEALRSPAVSKVVILPFDPTASAAPVSVPAPVWVPPAFTAAAQARCDTQLAYTVRLQAELAPHEPTHLFPPVPDQADSWTRDDTVHARAAARARSARR